MRFEMIFHFLNYGSGIPLTDELKTCQKWDIDYINENQTKYAKIAKAIWKL